jgi:hypothetical protein
MVGATEAVFLSLDPYSGPSQPVRRLATYKTSERMTLSEMNSKEKTIVAILSGVILVALIGIGILIALLVTRSGGDSSAPQISVVPASATGERATPAATITPVDTPSLQESDATALPAVSEQAVIVIQEKSIGPGTPAIITGQPLQPGREYRLVISAEDGSKITIQGSWSQAATSRSGEAVLPQIEFFEAATPFEMDLLAPVGDPAVWRFSVSAAPKDLLGQTSSLLITVWDATGTK